MSVRFLRFRGWIRSLSHNGNGCKFSGGDLEAKKCAAEQRQGNQDFCFRRALGLFQTRREFSKLQNEPTPTAIVRQPRLSALDNQIRWFALYGFASQRKYVQLRIFPVAYPQTLSDIADNKNRNCSQFFCCVQLKLQEKNTGSGIA